LLSAPYRRTTRLQSFSSPIMLDCPFCTILPLFFLWCIQRSCLCSFTPVVRHLGSDKPTKVWCTHLKGGKLEIEVTKNKVSSKEVSLTTYNVSSLLKMCGCPSTM
jgi:hypothetical protein